MSRFQRTTLLLLALLCLPVWAVLLYIILTLNTPEKLTIGTSTPLPTVPSSPTLLPTASLGEGLTQTPSSTPTPTLATRVLDIYAVMPGVVAGGAQVGEVSAGGASAMGVRAGIPVHLGPGDAGAATLGAGSGEPGKVYAYVGTSGWVAYTSAARTARQIWHGRCWKAWHSPINMRSMR